MSLKEDSTVDWGRIAADWVSQKKTPGGGGGAAPVGMAAAPPYAPVRPQLPFMHPGMMMMMPQQQQQFIGGGGFPQQLQPHMMLQHHPMMMMGNSNPMMMMGGAGGGGPPPPMMFCPPPLHPTDGSGHPYGHAYRPPPFVPPAPFVSPEAEMKSNHRGVSSQLPRWLVEAVQETKRGGEENHAVQPFKMPVSPPATEDEELGTPSGFLLTPPSSPKESSSSDTTSTTADDPTARLVKQRVTDTLLHVTESLIRDIAIDALNQCAVESRRAHTLQQHAALAPPVTVLRCVPVGVTTPTATASTPSSLLSQPSTMPLILAQPSGSTPPAGTTPVASPGGPPMVTMTLGQGPHPQHPPVIPTVLSTSTIAPVVPVPHAPVVVALREEETTDELLDMREDSDNGGHPFINPEDPKKGLFREPADCIALPKASELDETQDEGPNTATTAPASVIKCVCYSKHGKMLAETVLNGRTHLIIGSSPRQAHIIDSHTSVYSQHVAMAVCRKTTTSAPKPVVQCCLYIYPCGGSSKLIKPENVPFLRKAKLLEEAETADKVSEESKKLKEIVPQAVDEAADILNDGDKKREIAAGCEIYVQVGSSKRYYRIDCTAWTESYVIASTGEFVTPENASALLEETKVKSGRREEDDEDLHDGQRSHRGLSSRRRRQDELRSTSPTRRSRRFRSHSRHHSPSESSRPSAAYHQHSSYRQRPPRRRSHRDPSQSASPPVSSDGDEGYDRRRHHGHPRQKSSSSKRPYREEERTDRRDSIETKRRRRS